MRTFKANIIATFCLVLGAATWVGAASGASFLRIPVGARAVAMGSAYTALAQDASALHWNAAGLTGIQEKQFNVMHAEMPAETRYDFVGYAMPLKKTSGPSQATLWSMGIGAVYLSHATLDARDDSGNKTGSFGANDLALTLGFSRKISKRSHLGLNVKALQQSIDSDKAKGYALDIGYQARMPKLNIGFSLMNLGPSLKFADDNFSLPLTLGTGLSYNLTKGLMMTFDYSHMPKDGVTNLSFGGEFSVLSRLSFRGGYLGSLSSNTENNTGIQSQLSGLGMGFGLKLFSASQLDYAMTPMGELGVSQRFSFSYNF